MESSRPDMQLLLDFGPTLKLPVIEPSENAFSFGDSAETRLETHKSVECAIDAVLYLSKLLWNILSAAFQQVGRVRLAG